MAELEGVEPRRLTQAVCKSLAHSRKRGADRHPVRDGSGLLLVIQPSGAKSWIQRLAINGHQHDLGLGGFPLISLAKAKQKALENRRHARMGGDPLALKRQTAAPTFRDAAQMVIDIHRPTWRSPKSAAQWEQSLAAYAYPVIGKTTVDAVTTANVLKVLLPIWNTKRETAQRVRQRIGAVMKWAVAEGHRSDNPAGDAIGAALPKGAKVKNHQRALPHGQVAEAVAKVRASSAGLTTKLAFEFIVLTATRSGEARLATWAEFDLDERVWTIPGGRMKANAEHRVPLCARAVELLREAEMVRGDDLVFPSATGKPMSDSTLSKLVRELDIEAVPHGFRSSFRDWCGDTGQPRDIAEAALAHRIANSTEAAYARTDLFERRRKLMTAWAAYLDVKPGAVVPLPKQA